MKPKADMASRLDPELVEPLAGFLDLTGGGVDLHDAPAMRTVLADMFAAVTADVPPVNGVTSEDHHLPAEDGAPDVLVRVYRPVAGPESAPALLWIHGGGYVLGSIEEDDPMASHLAESIPCVVVSVEYRLSPEHPFPCSLDDCYTALTWLATNSNQLGIDDTRIAIGGVSAGGGLAAGLALLARDRGEVDVVFQLLVYPMLDDCNVDQTGDGLVDSFVWTRENNFMGWEAYLGRTPGGEGVSPYASAARSDDLAGLPPAYIPVGELDLFLNENIDYGRRLIEAGVAAEIHVYPGAYHGFDLLGPEAAVSQQSARDRDEALRRALHG